MTILERMRLRTAQVAAETKIETVKPLKEMGEERTDDGSTWRAWISYLHAIERHPTQREEFRKQFTRQTGLALS